MNLNKITKKLIENGINEFQLNYISDSSFEMKTFHEVIENYSSSISDVLCISAKINNKIVNSITKDLSDSSIDLLIKNLLKSSNYVNYDGELLNDKIYKYKKYKLLYNEDLSKIEINRKKQLILDIEKEIRKLDSRFKEVEVYYSESSSTSILKSSTGNKDKVISNGFSIMVEASLIDNDNIISESNVYNGNIFDKFNKQEFISELYEKIINKTSPIEIKSNKYKVIFTPENVALLTSLYISNLNADKVIKNVSFFKDKLNTLVASTKVTIIDNPLKKDLNFISRDFEGIPTSKLVLIKKGVLLTYLHSLRTAKKMGVESNAHGAIGGKVGAPLNLWLKPGKLSKEELLNKIKNGVYITSLEGLHAGYNSQSGDFSLKAEGNLIKDGKIDKPIKMMTVTGNVFSIFKDLKRISKEYTYLKEDKFAPYIEVDKIAISN